ncbi:methyltransferase [Streptomyces eurocidicus]|uniref:Methyltransferase n=1 Tax=Streptomyces eurocidicus TaxID=66423 RepID=A0A2N8P0D6_STREU|nr:methyltransferase [Streptomyces eurocidicus]MBB5121690.1 hypothetical protein [Streptomyces eurocidicus]PNE34484.1 methyltransferase [Streptomyces eurocidicus]
MSVNSVRENDRVYERFQLIVNGPALFNAVVTALELDVFKLLSDHPGSDFDSIRESTRVPAHQLRVLLHALCSTELVDKRDGGYTNSSVAQELLAGDGPDSWRHILLGWQKIYYPAFAQMTPALRAGTNTALATHPGDEPTLYQRLAHDPELEKVLHASMGAFTLQSVPGLLDNADLSTVRHLLDVGGGDGTTAKQLVELHPNLRVTVFDMPSVTEIAGSDVPEALAGRLALHPGDLFADAFPQDADAILFSHLLEVFSEEQIRRLLAKAYDALPSGGRIFLYGFDAADQERRGTFAARLSLYLNVLATGQGMAYPAGDYANWLERTGFSGVETYTDLPYDHALVTGTKK